MRTFVSPFGRTFAHSEPIRARRHEHGASLIGEAAHQVDEDVLERGAALDEGAQGDAGVCGDGSDRPGVSAADRQPRTQHLDVEARRGQGHGERLAVGGVHDDGPAVRIGERLDAAGQEQLPLRQDEHVVGDLLDLAQHVRRHEHGASLIGEAAHQEAHPSDALGVESVGRLVEDESTRVAEERVGDAQPLAHPEREAADAGVALALEPDQGEDFTDARERDAVRLRGDGQLALGRPARAVDGLLEHRADRAQRLTQLRIGGSADRGRAGGGADLTEQDAQRRGLAGSVRTQEGRHGSGLDAGGEVRDGGHLIEALRHVRELEHLSFRHP